LNRHDGCQQAGVQAHDAIAVLEVGAAHDLAANGAGKKRTASPSPLGCSAATRPGVRAREKRHAHYIPAAPLSAMV